MKLITLITLITVMTLMSLMALEAAEREKEEVTDDHRFLYAAFAHIIAFLLLCGSSEPESSRVQGRDTVVQNRCDKRAAYISSLRAGTSSGASFASILSSR